MGFIVGEYDNLAQGQAVALSYGGLTYRFVANYYGSSGNDLVLACADSRLFAWGWNEYRQLGNNTIEARRLQPAPVSSTDLHLR